MFHHALLIVNPSPHSKPNHAQHHKSHQWEHVLHEASRRSGLDVSSENLAHLCIRAASLLYQNKHLRHSLPYVRSEGTLESTHFATEHVGRNMYGQKDGSSYECVTPLQTVRDSCDVQTVTELIHVIADTGNNVTDLRTWMRDPENSYAMTWQEQANKWHKEVDEARREAGKSAADLHEDSLSQMKIEAVLDKIGAYVADQDRCAGSVVALRERIAGVVKKRREERAKVLERHVKRKAELATVS